MSWKSWALSRYREFRNGPPPFFVSVELVNICNLHCVYCFRDEDMLYGKASFIDPGRLLSLADSVPRGFSSVTFSFTGGEPLLHPAFGDIVRGIAAKKNATYSFVNNGWHFERALPHILETRSSLTSFCFSIDGASAEEHDAYRGKGSFDRVVRSAQLAREAKLPFQINVVLRKDSLPRMEALTLFAVRLGARCVNFGTLLPTSVAAHERWGLSPEDERRARSEAHSLGRMFRAKIEVSAGLFDPAPGPHCRPLCRTGVNVDYHGRISLCGNLSSFRGGRAERDVPSNAATLGLAPGFDALQPIALSALERRDQALRDAQSSGGGSVSALVGSPCLSCLNHFDKLSPELARRFASEPLTPATAS